MKFFQVWRINHEEKILLEAADQSKFYSGDCYIFQYSYPGEDREEHLVGTWFGKQSVEVNFFTYCITYYSLCVLIDDDLYRKTERLRSPWQARWLNP